MGVPFGSFYRGGATLALRAVAGPWQLQFGKADRDDQDRRRKASSRPWRRSAGRAASPGPAPMPAPSIMASPSPVPPLPVAARIRGVRLPDRSGFVRKLATLLLIAIATEGRALAISPAADLGLRPISATMSIIAVLPHRNQDQLYSLLINIAKGRAKPISHSEFEARFAPDPKSVARVATFLTHSGFSITRKTRDMIFATAPTGTVQQTFGVVIHNIRNSDRVDAYAAESPAKIPGALAGSLLTVVVDNLPMRWVH